MSLPAWSSSPCPFSAKHMQQVDRLTELTYVLCGAPQGPSAASTRCLGHSSSSSRTQQRRLVHRAPQQAAAGRVLLQRLQRRLLLPLLLVAAVQHVPRPLSGPSSAQQPLCPSALLLGTGGRGPLTPTPFFPARSQQVQCSQHPGTPAAAAAAAAVRPGSRTTQLTTHTTCSGMRTTLW